MILKATAVTEDATGYKRLLELLGSASDCLVAMEATGHYWRNLFTALVTAGFKITLIIRCAVANSLKRNCSVPRQML